MSDRSYNVLILCTGNSARSILAECLLHELGEGRINAYSAGSFPTGEVNPLALAELARRGLATDGLRSKSWDEFAAVDAPALDFVFTVCDSAAGESCPLWPGQPVTAHWGIPDPAAVQGDLEQRRAAFVAAADALERRVRRFLQLPLASLHGDELHSELDAIGRIDQRDTKQDG